MPKIHSSLRKARARCIPKQVGREPTHTGRNFGGPFGIAVEVESSGWNSHDMAYSRIGWLACPNAVKSLGALSATGMQRGLARRSVPCTSGRSCLACCWRLARRKSWVNCQIDRFRNTRHGFIPPSKDFPRMMSAQLLRLLMATSVLAPGMDSRALMASVLLSFVGKLHQELDTTCSAQCWWTMLAGCGLRREMGSLAMTTESSSDTPRRMGCLTKLYMHFMRTVLERCGWEPGTGSLNLTGAVSTY